MGRRDLAWLGMCSVRWMKEISERDLPKVLSVTGYVMQLGMS